MITDSQQQKANAIARKHHHGRATEVILGSRDRVISHTPYGYRKCSDGQYVPNVYRASFGWKNTYYQAAETVVEINTQGDQLCLIAVASLKKSGCVDENTYQ